MGSKGQMLDRLTSLAQEASVGSWLGEKCSQLFSENSPQATHLELQCVDSSGMAL